MKHRRAEEKQGRAGDSKVAVRLKGLRKRRPRKGAGRTSENRARRVREAGESLYKPIKKALEREHLGSYVIINIETADYVVGQTTSEVHATFIERFGESAPGWCTRIGTSVFATA